MRGARRPYSGVLIAALLGAAGRGAPVHGQVVIDEIHYHPRSDLREDEFIELYNTGPAEVDLSGWRFADGVEFTFPPGSNIDAGGYLVVAADAAALRLKRGLDAGEVTGDWIGALSNGGEDLVLVDARGQPIDRVRWSDAYPWPPEADGGGPSLECIDPRRDNDTPRNWLPSARGPSWVPVSVTGTVVSNRLYFYLEGAGECFVDAIEIREAGSQENIFPDGGFEDGSEGWIMSGAHQGSGITTADAWSGSASLRIVATGPGGSADASIVVTIDAMIPGRSYILTFRAKPISGSSSLICRVSGGGLIARTDLVRLEGTPGRENSRRGSNLPPLVTDFEVLPALPSPGEPARILVTFEDEDLAVTAAIVDQGTGPREIPLGDGGVPPDALAGDGVYTAEIPGAPRGSIVDVRVRAVDSAGQTAETPARRYPVASFDAVSSLPIYSIFIRDADWSALNADIWTERYFPAVFVHGGVVYGDAGLRFRGGRPRLFRKKALKVSFSEDHLFEGRRRLNLNAAAMDDDYLTEPLAYWFYERAGVDASRTRFVRVERNGEFWGLFIDVEGVDEAYLRRRGRNPAGSLYKSVGIVGSLRRLDGVLYQGQEYTYESQYEKKIRGEEPYDDLKSFIRGLDSPPAGSTEAFLESNLEVGGAIDYLAATNLLCLWDSIQHNFYIHRDTGGTGRWRIIPWDLDHAGGEWEWRYYPDDTFHLYMGTRSHPFAGVWYAWSELWTDLLETPRFRDIYLRRMRELLETRFAEGPIFGKIEAMRAEIEETVLLDEAKWPDHLEPQHTGPRRTMAEEIPLLEENISLRRRYLANLIGASTPVVPASPAFRRGDVNSDSIVDIADAIDLLFFLFLGGNSLDCADAADADDTGGLELTDPVFILRYLFARGPAPPMPGPSACGGDGPAADLLDCEISDCPGNGTGGEGSPRGP